MKRLPIHRRPYFAKRVLEIGGGHDPYAGVTHAVDKFPDHDGQRAGALKLSRGVRFFQGDVESLPFDSTVKFDFVYLSHVLEHVTSPERAVSELLRVARRGYIETPSPLREQIAALFPYDPNDFHLHFIWKSTRPGNAIAYIPKNQKTLGEFGNHPRAQMAKRLFELSRARDANLEAMLPREAKTTCVFFRDHLEVVRYESFAEAYAKGDDPYRSSEAVRAAIRWPMVLRSARFRKLRAALNP